MKIPGLTGLSLAMAMFLASGLAASDGGWVDKDGRAIPDTPSAKSKDGFVAMLVTTPDQDWQQKWETPDVAPHFSHATEVDVGGELFILTLLSNPKRDDSGNVDVTCDFMVTRPDGEQRINERDLPCFVTRLDSDPRNVYMTTVSMKYVEEPGDPRGEWKVNAVLRDNVRQVEIPLETSFTVK